MTDEIQKLRDELVKLKAKLEKQIEAQGKTGLSATVKIERFNKDGNCTAVRMVE